MKGHCIYNAKWERDPLYKEWIGPFKGDKKKALCRSCDRLIDISSMGESALKSHAKGAKHFGNLRLKQDSTLISYFGFGSAAVPSTSKSTAETELTVPLPPVDAEVRKEPSSITSFLTKDNVLRAEILWVLKLITNHHSFNSSSDISELLPKMFPDSEIAKQFKCGERKSSYICIFGLAEYFKKLLKESIKGPRAVCDYVNSVDRVANVDISKPLLLSVKQSRKKYELYLEQERAQKKSAQDQAKRKSTLEEIEEIKKKRRRLDSDIKTLNDTADQLLLKAEDQGNLRHLTQANSFRRTAKDKMDELVQVNISLDEKLKKLKE
ncbi:hypothetical protein AC249_AIPGENE28448 [Exaiptasia diaphana]|nr:hypothetical protein AC249_AIPGENE28448 [Exaiptasia diaphana]